MKLLAGVSCAVLLAVLAVALDARATGVAHAGAAHETIVIFKGSGKASQENSTENAGLKSASITLFWTEKWIVPASGPTTNVNEIDGKASEKYAPKYGKSCSGKVTTAKGGYEDWYTFPKHHDDIGLPVPISTGDAAETCYGGTGWYPFYPGGKGHSQTEYLEHVAYAMIPWAYGTPAKPACIPVRSAYWDDVVNEPGGDTLTEKIQWEGQVFLEVNGHKDTTCKAPMPATAAHPDPEP